MREYRRDFGYLPQIFGEGDRHKSGVSNIVAERLNIGSGEQYRKEKYIVENQSFLPQEDFADWDEGKLSTNKAFKRIKEEKEALEEKIKTLESASQSIQNYKQITEMIPELEELIRET